MPIEPPTDSQYGFVACQIIRRVADATDSDDFPDAVAASGQVLFKPQVQVSKVSSPSAFAVQETVTVTLDDQGRITSPGNASLFGVWLLAGVYSVTFQLNNATLPSLIIEVTTDHTPAAPLDLVTAGSYTPPTGVTVQTLIIPSTVTTGQVLMLDDTRTLVGVPFAALDVDAAANAEASAEVARSSAQTAQGAAVTASEQAGIATTAAVRAEQIVADLEGWEPGGGGSSSWSAITGKPAVIAAGESVVEARAVIGAVSVEDLPDVSGFATTVALSEGLAGKQPVGDYVLVSQLPDVSGLATKTALTEGLATKQPVGDYATTTALTSGLAGKQPVGDYALVSQLPDVSGLATTTALTSGLAGKQDAGDYATRAELPDVSGLATTAYVDQTVGDIDTVLSGILGGE